MSEPSERDRRIAHIDEQIAHIDRTLRMGDMLFPLYGLACLVAGLLLLLFMEACGP
ncbi:MAG: hypothetical protein AAGH15_05265 [Myxococcota bacterium]